MLAREDGSVASDHHEKEGILWNSFRDRIGVSVPIDSNFYFSGYIQPVEGLEDLSIPFSHEEIDNVVKEIPCDKAPGP